MVSSDGEGYEVAMCVSVSNNHVCVHYNKLVSGFDLEDERIFFF